MRPSSCQVPVPATYATRGAIRLALPLYESVGNLLAATRLTSEMWFALSGTVHDQTHLGSYGFEKECRFPTVGLEMIECLFAASNIES